jgi:hypothetical protein
VISGGVGTEDVCSVFVVIGKVEDPIIELVVEMIIEGGIVPVWGNRLFVFFCEELFVLEGDLLVKESLFEVSGSPSVIDKVSSFVDKFESSVEGDVVVPIVILKLRDDRVCGDKGGVMIPILSRSRGRGAGLEDRSSEPTSRVRVGS